MSPRPRIRTKVWYLILVFILMAVGLTVAGNEWQIRQRREHRKAVEATLNAVADLKVAQIDRWRRERRIDAVLVTADRRLARLVERFAMGPRERPVRHELETWASAVRREAGYSGLFVLDASGTVILASGASREALSATDRARALTATQHEGIAFGDITRDERTGAVVLDLDARFVVGSERPVGILVLRVDLDEHLFPLLQTWPTPSQSSESLLVRREGDEIVFLSELRHREGAALTLRLPAAHPTLPAALAGRGVEGIVEGVDYRGVPVVAAARQVPGSPWYLIAKTDLEEVNAPLHRRDRWLFAAVFLLVALTAAAVLVFWHQQRAAFFERQYQVEVEREALVRHYDYLTRYANDVVVLYGEDRRIVEANDRASAAYGYSREELVGMPISDLYPPELRADLKETLATASGRNGIVHETVQRRKDGSAFPAEASTRLIDTGGRRFFQSIVRDITERKQAEEALAAEKERLVVTLASIGDAVVATDVEGRITFLNNVAERLTGWSREEALGLPLDEVLQILNQNTRARCESPVAKVLETGAVGGLANHAVLVARNGAERVIADGGAPIHDVHGQLIGVVLVFRDVTDKERMDQELARAQKLESIAVLAGGIAHDFNNILTGVIGYLSLARHSLAGDNQTSLRLQEAEKAALRAKELTQQLLTFSKGGAPVLKPLHLPELIKDAVAFALRGSATVAEYAIASDLWPVEADRGQLGQALSNVALNAVQAMPDGGHLHVRAQNVLLDANRFAELPAGRYVEISLRDEGIGIPERLLDRIFDPYYTTKQRGSGLGLATTYSIVKKHDGHISVESVLEAGSTFTLYLPATARVVEEAAGARVEAPSGGGRVLIMDDEAVVRSLVATTLSGYGFSVESARDGSEALELYRKAKDAERPFDAVILDLTVPGGMGGKEAARRLQEIDPQARIIVSSGYSNDPVMADYRNYGFSAVLTKPYGVGEMLTALREMMGWSR